MPLEPTIHSEARQAEAWHVMTRQPAPYNLRRPGIVNRDGAQTIKSENGFAGIVNRKESFRAAAFVTLAGVTAQEFVERFVTAVETFPIMFLVNRLFVPRCHDYRRFGNARAAASSLALGAGGFSSRLRTRKLSLSE